MRLLAKLRTLVPVILCDDNDGEPPTMRRALLDNY